jgi:hypothetical protein
MMRVMDCCVNSREYGLVLKPFGKWNGRVDCEKFVITGVSDSDYAKDIKTRCSVSGYSVLLNRASVVMKSNVGFSDTFGNKSGIGGSYKLCTGNVVCKKGNRIHQAEGKNASETHCGQ